MQVPVVTAKSPLVTYKLRFLVTASAQLWAALAPEEKRNIVYSKVVDHGLNELNGLNEFIEVTEFIGLPGTPTSRITTKKARHNMTLSLKFAQVPHFGPDFGPDLKGRFGDQKHVRF